MKYSVAAVARNCALRRFCAAAVREAASAHVQRVRKREGAGNRGRAHTGNKWMRERVQKRNARKSRNGEWGNRRVAYILLPMTLLHFKIELASTATAPLATLPLTVHHVSMTRLLEATKTPLAAFLRMCTRERETLLLPCDDIPSPPLELMHPPETRTLAAPGEQSEQCDDVHQRNT
jgi:hypothetical protein